MSGVGAFGSDVLDKQAQKQDVNNNLFAETGEAKCHSVYTRRMLHMHLVSYTCAIFGKEALLGVEAVKGLRLCQ